MTELVVPSDDELAWLEELVTKKSYYNHYILDTQVIGVKFLQACLAFTKSGKRVPLSSIHFIKCQFKGSPDVFINIFQLDNAEVIFTKSEWPVAVAWGKSLTEPKCVQFRNLTMDIGPVLKEMSQVGSSMNRLVIRNCVPLIKTSMVIPTVTKLQLQFQHINESTLLLIGCFPNVIHLTVEGDNDITDMEQFKETIQGLKLSQFRLMIPENLVLLVEALPVYPNLNFLQLHQLQLEENTLVALEAYFKKYQDHNQVLHIGYCGQFNGPRQRVMDFYRRLQFMPFQFVNIIEGPVDPEVPYLETSATQRKETNKINARFTANRQFIRRLAMMNRLGMPPEMRMEMYLMEVGKWDIV